MRIAIPVHNHRVSPVLDTACVLHVYDIPDDDTQPPATCEVRELASESIERWIDSIRATRATSLICGAVSQRAAWLIRQLGIELIPWVVGLEADVIEAFKSNELSSDRFCMPGCRRNRRRGMGRRCGYRNRQNKDGGTNQ